MALQQRIIKALGAKPQINAEEEIRRSVDFLKSYLQTYPFIKSLVLGISGRSGLHACRSCARWRLMSCAWKLATNHCNFLPYACPYGVQADEQDCQDAIAFIQPDRINR